MVQATQEAFCSQEVAKLLEEKGFIKDCARIHAHCNPYDPYLIVDILIAPNTPTHQTAMRWLREVKHLHIVITIDGSQELKDKWLDERGVMVADCVCLYDFSIYNTKTGECRYSNSSMFDSLGYLTYGEAVEAALKFVLGNLI